MASLNSAERRAFALKINRGNGEEEGGARRELRVDSGRGLRSSGAGSHMSHSSAEIRRHFSGTYAPQHSRTNSNASASVSLNVPYISLSLTLLKLSAAKSPDISVCMAN
ncbi:hypothetical protein EYF80_031776 [Liparis tanakae]|uniref:Uncharacterized protein n=1 Tax=Liparis tanakae TaxID=230148 RepID=A0A4Z2GWR6_9TELE|nr:hypothetical protein EYF80_031776 [Liparis tanakae]